MEMKNVDSDPHITSDLLYSDLPAVQFDHSLKQLEEKNKILEVTVTKLQSQNKEITEKNADLFKKVEVLSLNISSLYKTATAEIQRKNNIISELRKEKEAIVFRRHHRSPYRISQGSRSRENHCRSPETNYSEKSVKIPTAELVKEKRPEEDGVAETPQIKESSTRVEELPVGVLATAYSRRMYRKLAEEKSSEPVNRSSAPESKSNSESPKPMPSLVPLTSDHRKNDQLQSESKKSSQVNPIKGSEVGFLKNFTDAALSPKLSEKEASLLKGLNSKKIGISPISSLWSANRNETVSSKNEASVHVETIFGSPLKWTEKDDEGLFSPEKRKEGEEGEGQVSEEPAPVRIPVRHEETTLGQFDDTILFVNALRTVAPQVSPIKTPVKDNKADEPDSKESQSWDLPSKSPPKLELTPPKNYPHISISSTFFEKSFVAKVVPFQEEETFSKAFEGKPINILQPRKTPRFISSITSQTSIEDNSSTGYPNVPDNRTVKIKRRISNASKSDRKLVQNSVSPKGKLSCTNLLEVNEKVSIDFTRLCESKVEEAVVNVILEDKSKTEKVKTSLLCNEDKGTKINQEINEEKEECAPSDVTGGDCRGENSGIESSPLSQPEGEVKLLSKKFINVSENKKELDKSIYTEWKTPKKITFTNPKRAPRALDISRGSPLLNLEHNVDSPLSPVSDVICTVILENKLKSTTCIHSDSQSAHSPLGSNHGTKGSSDVNEIQKNAENCSYPSLSSSKTPVEDPSPNERTALATKRPLSFDSTTGQSPDATPKQVLKSPEKSKSALSSCKTPSSLSKASPKQMTLQSPDSSTGQCSKAVSNLPQIFQKSVPKCKAGPACSKTPPGISVSDSLTDKTSPKPISRFPSGSAGPQSSANQLQIKKSAIKILALTPCPKRSSDLQGKRFKKSSAFSPTSAVCSITPSLRGFQDQRPRKLSPVRTPRAKEVSLREKEFRNSTIKMTGTHSTKKVFRSSEKRYTRDYRLENSFSSLTPRNEEINNVKRKRWRQYEKVEKAESRSPSPKRAAIKKPWINSTPQLSAFVVRVRRRPVSLAPSDRDQVVFQVNNEGSKSEPPRGSAKQFKYSNNSSIKFSTFNGNCQSKNVKNISIVRKSDSFSDSDS